jgi:predicted RNase H-like HicB family nuclease
MGKTYDNIIEMAKDAKKICLENNTAVLLTIGGDGMIYANQNNVYMVSVPTLPVSTTVGAGDTVLASLPPLLKDICPPTKPCSSPLPPLALRWWEIPATSPVRTRRFRI